jgi:hypothetical protein
MCKFASPFHPDYVMVTKNLAELAERAVGVPNGVQSYGIIPCGIPIPGENLLEPAFSLISNFLSWHDLSDVEIKSQSRK